MSKRFDLFALALVLMSGLIASPALAVGGRPRQPVAPVVTADPVPTVTVTFPANLANPFDWQKEWGSIHMNSAADGLNDHGIPASSTGVVACAPDPKGTAAGARSNCEAFTPGGIAGGAIIHGIKYDIKNSFLNCVSSQLPNCAVENDSTGCLHAPANNPTLRGPYTDGYVCPSSKNTKGNTRGKAYGDPFTLVYMPYYDPRSLDNRRDGKDALLGYQQLITNNCIRDIHAEDPGRGLFSPISHVFAPEEKANWQVDATSKGLKAGDQLPETYYYYQQQTVDTEGAKPNDTEGATPKIIKGEWIVSSIAPAVGDYVDGTLKVVDNYSNDLANIKAYSIANTADKDSFVIVDPSQFYDLLKYKDNPTPLTNCPVLGLKMYGGICDPTGKAGCNLPIYGVGPETTLTGQSGKQFTSRNFPILWSGYVKKWSFIKSDQYWDLVKDRVSIDGSHLYRQPYNSNPVLMIERAASYCNYEEMTSSPTKSVTDMPCIQYVQYTSDSVNTLAGKFIDLYDPTNDVGTKNNAATYVVKHDYNINADGTFGSPTNVSFFDTAAKFANGKNIVENIQAVDVDGKPRPGVKNGTGSGITFAPGTSIAVQLHNETVKWPDKLGVPRDVNCMELTNHPMNDGKTPTAMFIPTKTREEYQSFLDAIVGGMSGVHVTANPCVSRFKLYESDGKGTNPNGTKTWYGKTDCSQITAPSCNQVVAISAQRYCQRSSGFLGTCDECLDSPEVDNKLTPGVSGSIASYDIPDANGGTNACYYKAYCYSRNVCPGLVSGGHVFCLAADTKIAMADGKEKPVQDVKAGDEVMAFDAKASRGTLRTAKVRAAAVTKNQALVQLNDLKITPLHKVVLANGRAVMAKEVKVGDSILKGDGLFMEVTKVTHDLPPVTVYNLVLENADGYIADGLRVMQYAIPAELVK